MGSSDCKSCTLFYNNPTMHMNIQRPSASSMPIHLSIKQDAFRTYNQLLQGTWLTESIFIAESIWSNVNFVRELGPERRLLFLWREWMQLYKPVFFFLFLYEFFQIYFHCKSLFSHHNGRNLISVYLLLVSFFFYWLLAGCLNLISGGLDMA